jgi:hypothetical protein
MIRTIRRGFWLAVGAAVGVGGYRKVTRLARAVSPGYPPAGGRSAPAGSASIAGPAAAALVRGVRASALFARDVREGMRIYRRAGGRAAPGLAHRRGARDWAFADGECPDEVKDGR